MPVPSSVWLYHITHIDNLTAIVREGGLLAHNGVDDAYTDIAHQTIQIRRNNTPVPCMPGGQLHDYVPFYFCRRSPMLYAIHKGNILRPHKHISIVKLTTPRVRSQTRETKQRM